MALIVDIATILGAAATVLGVAIAIRSRSRSNREPAGAERGQSSSQHARRGAARLDIDTPVKIPDNLLLLDSATHAAWRAGGAMSSEEFARQALQSTQVEPRPAARAFEEQVREFEASVRASRPAVTASIPTWVTSLMPATDARRYAREWGAHLYQLIEEGQLKQARRDRRALALAGLLIAIALRARRVLGRRVS